MLIKLENRGRQSVRTQLFVVGRKKGVVVEIAIPPKSSTVTFEDVLLTDIAKDQVRKKLLYMAEFKSDHKYVAPIVPDRKSVIVDKSVVRAPGNKPTKVRK